MATAWFKWVEAALSRQNNQIQNLEESLKSYERTQRRMLYAIMGMVVINGILLFVS